MPSHHCGVVDASLLAELHVDPALADARAAHAGEIRLAADLQREAAVHEVVPAFHSRMRAVSIALMKSHTPCAAVTQISCAPTPFISGMAKFGSRSAARSWLAFSSASPRTPSRSASISANGSGSRPLRGLGGGEPAVLVRVELPRAAARSRPPDRSAGRCRNARSR